MYETKTLKQGDKRTKRRIEKVKQKWFVGKTEISIKRKLKQKQKQQRNSRAEKYNKWTLNLTEVNLQFWTGRTTTQWPSRQDNGIHQGWGTERKRTEEEWTEPKRSTGHHQKDQYTAGGPWGGERVKRGQKEHLKQIMIGNSSNLMKDKNVNAQEVQQNPLEEFKETHTETDYNQTFKKTNSKNLEGSNCKANHHIQGILNKIISRFFGSETLWRL